MLRNVFAKQNIPIYTGIALGGALAYLYHTVSYSQLRADSPKQALDPNQFIPLKIASSKFISSNTKEIVIALPEGEVLGGETASMVMFRYQTAKGSNVIRPYTPVTPTDHIGEAKFVIKAYKDGKMSQHVHGLEAGDTIEVKGPIQKYPVTPNKHRKISLIGGGTGITPLFQVLQKIANDPNDKTEVQLLYANSTPEDVLIKDEIDAEVAKKPNQLSVKYFVSRPNDAWKGEKGRITKEVLEQNLFKPSEENVKVFVCGPPPFHDVISGNKVSPADQGELTGALKDLGFSKEQVFKF